MGHMRAHRGQPRFLRQQSARQDRRGGVLPCARQSLASRPDGRAQQASGVRRHVGRCRYARRSRRHGNSASGERRPCDRAGSARAYCRHARAHVPARIRALVGATGLGPVHADSGLANVPEPFSRQFPASARALVIDALSRAGFESGCAAYAEPCARRR